MSSSSLSVDSVHTSGTLRTTRREGSHRLPPKHQPPTGCSRARHQCSRTPTNRVLSRPMSLVSSTPFGSHWGPSCSRAVIFHHGKKMRLQVLMHFIHSRAVTFFFPEIRTFIRTWGKLTSSNSRFKVYKCNKQFEVVYLEIEQRTLSKFTINVTYCMLCCLSMN